MEPTGAVPARMRRWLPTFRGRRNQLPKEPVQHELRAGKQHLGEQAMLEGLGTLKKQRSSIGLTLGRC